LESFAKLKLLFLDAKHAHADDAQIQLGQFATQIEIDPDVRSAVRVGRRILNRISHGLRRTIQKNATLLLTNTSTVNTRITGKPIAVYIAIWRLSRPCVKRPAAEASIVAKTKATTIHSLK
jgi:hypothetical protein